VRSTSVHRFHIPGLVSCILVGALALAMVWPPAAQSKELEGDQERQVVRFGPGVHEIEQIVLDAPHALLEGAGRGVTIVKVPGGVLATAPEPVIRDLTIVGNGTGVGLTLRDVWTARVDDVEIESYGTGIRIELTQEGRISAGGKTLNGWPGALTAGNHWGSRVTLTELRGVEIIGDGDGIVLVNKLKDSTVPGKYWKATNDSLNGEFFTGTTIWGGHIYVQGRALVIGDGVWVTTVFGTYFDIGPGGGVVMEYGSQWLRLINANFDLSSAAKLANAPKISVATKREAKSIRFVGAGVGRKDVLITGKKK
jgi:hypothetical protein